MNAKSAFALVPDILLRSKVQGLAEGAGLSVRFFGAPDELFDALAGEGRPQLLILDLSDRGGLGLSLLDRLQGTNPPPTLGFYAHVEDEVRRRALELGVTRVVPRSLLVKKFEELVRETAGS